MSEGKIFLCVLASAISLVISIVTFAVGAATAYEKGHCRQDKIASYFPSYFIGCELFRSRWPEGA